MSPDDMNSGDAAPFDGEADDDNAAGDNEAAKEEAKAAKKAAAAAAKAAKAEEGAAKKEAKRAAREASAAQKAERKAGKRKAGRKKASAQEEVADPTPAADGPSPEAPQVSPEEEASSTLPAKVGKEKKPKKARKVKASSAKEVRRAIRPIRSKSQQTTARLIWAVFGMALVIVAIVGFWVVLSNQDDSTEIAVLIAARSLTEGNLLEIEDTEILIKEDDGTAYLPAANAESLYGRVILRDVPENTLLAIGMFGEESYIAADGASPGASPLESEIEIPLNFPGEVTMPEGDISAGDLVVIFVRQGESPEKYAFEVVRAAAVVESTIEIEGSYEDKAWWDRELASFGSQGEDATGTSVAVSFKFELESVDPYVRGRSVNDLCWRERFRQIYGINALPINDYEQRIRELDGGAEAVERVMLARDDYEQLIRELECPLSWIGEEEPEEPEPSDTEEGAETETTTTTTLSPDSISQRLERERFAAEASAASGTGTTDNLDDLFANFPGP